MFKFKLKPVKKQTARTERAVKKANAANTDMLAALMKVSKQVK